MSAPMNTEGPWFAKEYGYEKHAILGEKGEDIAFVHRRRDARLIAASPELLEAAKNLLLTFDSYGKERLPEYVRKEFAPLIAAVRKAEGGDA